MTTPPTDASVRRGVAGRSLLIIAALTAAFASGMAIAQLSTAGSEHIVVDAWRAFGLTVFAGLFALVAWRPTSYPGLMELAFAHKVGMALIGWSQLGEARDSWTALIVDGLLALVLLVAYVLLGCHRAWRRPRAPKSAPAEAPAAGRGKPSKAARKLQERKASGASGEPSSPGAGSTAPGGGTSRPGTGSAGGPIGGGGADGAGRDGPQKPPR
ncbi:hypothetical protein [Nesterenkonia sp. F]|uniref:hypothetical protein n=1 Tax=Nesterenkonia sp. F TaxID=795955 RepID=UPI000255D189|nr:hypothetical protein [Nesterenkonia sp. F]